MVYVLATCIDQVDMFSSVLRLVQRALVCLRLDVRNALGIGFTGETIQTLHGVIFKKSGHWGHSFAGWEC